MSLPAPPKRLRARQRAVGLVERDGVVAALAEHLDQAGVGDRRRAADDRHGAAVDEDVAGRVAADGDRVVEVVAEHGERAGREGGFDGHGRSLLSCAAAGALAGCLGGSHRRLGCGQRLPLTRVGGLAPSGRFKVLDFAVRSAHRLSRRQFSLHTVSTQVACPSATGRTIQSHFA